MITGISIQNFKGIRGIEGVDGELKPLEIELRPLTLFFGANSAGKSSILHALQYAAEVFERRNLDAGLIGDGAAGVDLGGFQNFVHGHNPNLDVTLGFEFTFPLPQSFPGYSTRTPRDVDDPSSLYGLVKSFRVSVTIGWSDLRSAPFVRRYAVSLDGADLAEIQYEPGSPDCELLLNEKHPTFVRDAGHSSLQRWHPLEADQLDDCVTLAALLSWAGHIGAVVSVGPAKPPYTSIFGLRGLQDAFPDFTNPLNLEADWERSERDPQLQREPIGAIADYLTDAISQVVLGPGRIVRESLVNSRFLGPIREVPQRNHTPSRQQERARWSSGLGAWDRLETADNTFIEAVSSWLGDENRLNSGYRLRLKRYKEMDLSDPLVVKLLTGRAFDEADAGSKLDLSQVPTQSRVLIVPVGRTIELRPNDVGIGISQVVPVIVTALDGAGRTVVVEQPELHLHPKLQAELADLFIESAKGKPRHLVLLETHSELIPLRIMRRIRETFEKHQSERVGLAEEDVAIYYVETYNGSTIVTRLHLSDGGKLLDPWPGGFFEEGYRERFAE